MSELEDKLNKILSSPEDMQKIIGLARSLSSSLGAQGEQGAGREESAELPVDPSPLAGLLRDLDPRVLRMFGRLASEYSSGSNDKAALLNAIKPYLREDRRAKIDKAAEVARLAKLAKVAISEFSGGGRGV